MPASPEHTCLLRLLLSGAPASALRRLLDTHGNAELSCRAGQRDWTSHGLDADACNAIRTPDAGALARGERWLDAPSHYLVGWRDDTYPPLLRRIASPPAMLFVAGDPGLLWRPSVAVCRTRR